ncbi:TM2 domain-containing protein [Altererythrobacter sp. ZODW24]|uniref:TM2 domain-containing protein n=1 Tax=Altererythrobacter sp. ZODW24 TaxID=2185142 RepID=UPI001F07802B|nr:TM2 domain-containing protein [Altererythrobacter sp. ZODW24]
MDDSTRDQMLFEANRKSTGASYLLWFFLGGLGAHRFYLGRTGTAITQALLALFGWLPLGLGWLALGIWWIVDAFLIPSIIREEDLETIRQLDRGHHLNRDSRSPETIEPATKVLPKSDPIPGSRADNIRKLSS